MNVGHDMSVVKIEKQQQQNKNYEHVKTFKSTFAFTDTLVIV